MESHEDERPAKRFKHQSYKQSLKDVHLPSALSQSKFDIDIADSDSHFAQALEQWKELNLSPAFVNYVNKVERLCASMPLLLHNWEQVVVLWLDAVESADDEALKPLLDLFQKLAHDLRTTISPKYPDVLKQLLRLLPRSLSAATLTALLATFSSLFKYILIPSIEPVLLDQAWSLFRDILPKCSPEVQRAVAEVWGATLRRLKTSAREQYVALVVEDSEGSLADVCAWIIVTAAKSVSQSLHTATAPIFRALLRQHLSRDSPEASYTLIRRVMTALIHHCKYAEQFSPVADVLVEFVVEGVRTADEEGGEERLRRLLEVATTALSVRQGSRLSAKHLSTLLEQFPSISLTDNLHGSLLRFTSAVLLAGDMSLWMGPGRRAFERSWERPVLAIELCGVLSDLGWGGWKLIALPHIKKATFELLETHTRKTLTLLVALHREKRLGDVDIVWKQRFQTWAQKGLAGWQGSEENVLLLSDILSLSSLLPSISASLVKIVEATLQTPDPQNDYTNSFGNSSWVLGSCFQALALQDSSEWKSLVDLTGWTRKVVASWGWSSIALGGLVSLIKARPHQIKVEAIPLEELYPHLQDALLSHSRSLRLASLRLLTSAIVKTSAGPAEVLERCLQGEEVALDVQGARERVLRIGRLPQFAKTGDALGAQICARWLIAQLKVNLRPVWSPAAEALSVLAERFDDDVWNVLFQEVQFGAESGVGGSFSTPEWMSELPTTNDVISEDEKTWRDPSAHKLRCAITIWTRGSSTWETIVKAQILDDRFDPTMYKVQLLSALGECASLAEKHNRDLIPYFLASATPLTKLPRQQLSAWLTLFAKFSNPKALRSTAELHSIYRTLLSHPDRSLQRLALSCLLTYKSSSLIPYQDTLRLLLDDTKWRDELTTLNMQEIDPEHREEFVDVLVKILFGIMLEKRGRTRGADRRAAVLTALGGCTDEELQQLVDLMLQPMKATVLRDEGNYTMQPVSADISDSQQVGFLTLLGDVLKHLGTRMTSRWAVLLQTVLDLTGHAQSRSEKSDTQVVESVEDEEEEEADAELDEDTTIRRSVRVVRQLGLKRFADFFRAPVSYDFKPYMTEAYRVLISPRLPMLDLENTQNPSALLELLHVWSFKEEYVLFLVDYDDRTLPKVYDCLIARSVKPAVVSKVFDIVDSILLISTSNETVRDRVLKAHVTHLLTNLSILLSNNKDALAAGDTLGRRQISVLSELAQYLSNAEQASTLLNIFSPLLRKPHKVVPEKVKVELINISSNLLRLVPEMSDPSSVLYNKTYTLLSQLFQSLRSRQARIALVNAFNALADINTSLSSLASLMASLNAYSTKRLEEPDFDRRLDAFATLNQSSYSSLSCKEWLPILYNMLNFIQDPDELTIRNNAAFAFKHFIDLACVNNDPEFDNTFIKVLYPGLKNGLRSNNELVRAEILGVVAHAVAKYDRIAALQEMRVLLAGGDEEANFFNNIHHIQVHRRIRAIHRLADYTEGGHLRSATLAEVFIPLVSNYIVSSSSVDHHLVTEAIQATGRMSRQLKWGAYYSLIQRYLRLAKVKDASERIYVRMLVSLLDNFHFSMEVVMDNEDIQDVARADEPGNELEDETAAAVASSHAADMSRISDVVNTRLLPSLLRYLEKRDETEDSLRIPISVGIVQVAKHLPESTREPQISRLLTVLSQVLRSKSQETRDLARETLCRIAIILGPSYLPAVFREMRAALLRGPHLHVLAYAIHAVLVHVTSAEHTATFSCLDSVVDDVATVSAEVIFGESGKDVQAEGFKTKMREVRSSSAKGLDSFGIIAKYITPSRISSLLMPIRAILRETETLKALQLTEDVLRRVAGGLNANEHLAPPELLVLCHTLITQDARFLKASTAPKGARGKHQKGSFVQLKRKQNSDADHYANNSFRFVAFGLDLFNTAHRRGRFDFQDRNVISRLESMVSVIGNVLYSNQLQVVIPALKAVSAIVKCPLKSVEKSLPVFIHQMVEIIKQTGSTESEASQAAFRSLAAILRDRPDAHVKEKDLIYLLELLEPDLEEPTRQAAVFAVLRAIVARKFVVPEIYDMMDKVSEVMVTSQSPQVQELCRGVVLQFLLDYPQGKGRLRNHMTFLAKNLSYVYESGRKSVMELLSAILSKFQIALVREYSDLLFVALVMVIANDDSAKCREMAAELIKSLFSRLEAAQRNVLMAHLHAWASQQTQPPLARVSLQIYGLIVDLLQKDAAVYTTVILEDVNAALARSSTLLEAATVEDDEDNMAQDIEWQIPYHALIVLAKILVLEPERCAASASAQVRWADVVTLLLHPHAWVRTAAARLLGLVFSARPVAAPRDDDSDEDIMFTISGMEDLGGKFCAQLRSPHLDAALSLQVVKNLFFVGKCFCAMPTPLAAQPEEVSAEEESDGSDADNAEANEGSKGRHPLRWLFSKLSYQARSAHIARRNKSSSSDNWFHQPASILKWFAAMVSHMEPAQTQVFLMHILSPVYRFIEDDTIRDPHMDELKTLAVELQDLVQAKVGATAFAEVYNRIRQSVLGVRRERKTARIMQATSNPKAAAKRKMQRNSLKKESRKRKTSGFVDVKKGRRKRMDS